jgi:hypothetical protein
MKIVFFWSVLRVFATFSEVVGYRLTNYTVPELRRPQSTFSLTSQMSYHTDINVNNCRLHTYMCTSVVDEWCRFVYANLILVCCSNFSRVCRTIHTAYSDIVMPSTRYNLNTFKSTSQNNNVATSSICLKQPNQHHYSNYILHRQHKTLCIQGNLCNSCTAHPS